MHSGPRTGTEWNLFFKKRKNEQPPQTAQAPQRTGRDFERFMSRVYRNVSCHRNSEAVHMLLEEYDYLQTPLGEIEDLYRHVEQWGPSRTLLCLGRLMIYRLDREKRFPQVLDYIAKCQQFSPRFQMPDLSRVTFFARQAIDAGKLELARNLVVEHESRYGDLVGGGECERLLQLIEPDIDVTSFRPGE